MSITINHQTNDISATNGSLSVGGGALSNRNMVINGGMTISQRGTSNTGITSSEYADAPDRFKIVLATAGTWTASQSSVAPDEFSSSYKVECTTADASLASSDVFLLKHIIEAQNLQGLAYGTSSAKQATLSFWVRSNKTGTYVVEIDHDDAGVYMNIPYTVDAADTWEYKTLTFSGNTSTAIANDSGAGFEVNWWLSAGSNYTSGARSVDTWQSTQANRVAGQTVNLADTIGNTWQLTGVQLEVGDTATPFEHRSYGDELARCQRYYYNTYTDVADVGGSGFSGFVTAVCGPVTNDRYFTSILFPTEMRADPTTVFYAGRDGVADTAARVVLYNAPTLRSFSLSPYAHKKGLAGYFDTGNNDNAVRFQATFDAEL